MTTMIVEVYEALRAIDVPDDKVKAAAQALTQDMNREVASLGSEIAALRKEMATEFASVRADIASIRPEVAVLRWMNGTAIAFLIAVTLKLFLA